MGSLEGRLSVNDELENEVAELEEDLAGQRAGLEQRRVDLEDALDSNQEEAEFLMSVREAI